MSLAKDVAQDLTQNVESTRSEWEAAGVVVPPTPLFSDEPPLETDLHWRQILLLITCLEWLWGDRQDFYCAGNLTIYYSSNQLKSEDFRGPDFFVVLDTERKSRNCWVVWEEDGRYPNVIVDLLSKSTATTDRGLKKAIYQNTFRTPEYFWFDPHTLEFQGFQLVGGQYHPLVANPQGWLWSQQLQLFLGLRDRQLRFFTPDGELVPSPTEAAQLAEQAAQQAKQRANLAENRAEVAEDRAQQAELLLERYRQQFGDLGL